MIKTGYISFVFILLISVAGCSSRKATLSKNKKGEVLSQKKENQFASTLIQATTEKIVGNYDFAEELFQESLKIKPKSAVSHFELSGIYDYKKDARGAIEYARKALYLNPDNDWYKTNLAVLYQKYGLYDRSLPLYEELSKDHPERYEYLFTLAENYLYLGKIEHALSIYDKIQAKVGNTEELAVHKENLYLELGQVDKATKEIENLIAEYPNNASYYGLLAELYQKTGNDEKAIELYTKVKEMDKFNPNVNFALYNFYKEKGKEEKARQELEDAFKNPEASIDSKIRILLAYLKTQNEEDKKTGERLAKLLVETHPDNAKSHTAIAEFYYQNQKNEEALGAYKKSLALDENQFLLWEQVVFIEADLQWYDSLEIDSEKAIELFPTQPLFYFFSGLGKLYSDKTEEAIERLNQGKDLVLNNQKMLMQFYEKLGNAYLKQKDYKLAYENYDKALEIYPDNDNLLNNYSYYLAQSNQQLEKAEKMAKKANDLSPQNANYLDTYAWVLFRKGQYEKALDLIEEALQYGGENSATILEHFGDINYFLNNIETAVEYWQKALDKKGESSVLQQKIENKSYIEE